MPVGEKGFVNEGEAFGEMFSERGDVEEDAGGTGAFDLSIDGSGYDVTGSEGSAWIVVFDKFMAFSVDDDGSSPRTASETRKERASGPVAAGL